MNRTVRPLFGIFLILSICLACQKSKENTTKKTFVLTASDDAFLDTLQKRSFLYFLHEINPINGLVKDRSTENSPASIAAVGFAFPSWAIGGEHGWISRERAAQLTLNSLKFFINSPQSQDGLATGYKGFYYHFLDMNNGQRYWNCELSSIDTAWLLAGIIFARNYFNNTVADEVEIRRLADELLSRPQWDWFAGEADSPFPYTIHMGWDPERTFGKSVWKGYNEGLFIYVLAAGSGSQKAALGYKTWLSSYRWGDPYGYAYTLFPPLFGYQYSQMFVDFRDIQDSYMREKNSDYFENSRRAVYAQREYAIENPGGWAGYDSLIWGLTACDGPGRQKGDSRRFKTYSARGAAGPDFVWDDDGTIAPTATGGSIPFAPGITIPALKAMYQQYGPKGLWGPYGFYDSFNPTLNWIDPDYLGIDQGPIVIMIENYRTGFVWKYMMQDEIIKRGLDILGFQKKTN